MSRRSDDVLGVALAPESVTATAGAMRVVWQGDIELNGGANGAREALAEAMRDATKAHGAPGADVVVALMPPLAETRTLSLPPLREDERNRFIARNASRYFVNSRGAQVVGTRLAMPTVRPGVAAPVVATAATQQLVQAVHGGIGDAGCVVRAVVPAEAAWAASAAALWPSLARGSAHVVMARADRADLLALVDGRLAGVRRFRGPADAAAIAAAATAGRPVGVAGPADAAAAMAAALGAAGVHTLLPEARWRDLSERPDALAARFAADATDLRIESEETRAQQRAMAGRAAAWMAGAAAALLVLAGAIHFVGVRRELAAVQAERARIRPQVDASLVGRSSVDAAYRQVAALAGVSRSATRWSLIMAALTDHLPEDASLTALRARGDSLFLDGVALQAAPVFDAVARTPGLDGVRATAPVRRDAIEGEVPLEHFSLGARLSGPRR